MSISEVVGAMHEHDEGNSQRLVVTGGEPLLQAEVLSELAAALVWWDCELETNGTIVPPPTLVDRGWQFNVSPKLMNSGVTRTLRYKPEVLRHFCHIGNAYFKFVVSVREDLAEVNEIVSDCEIMPDRVVLMPEGTDLVTVVKRGMWVAEACKQRNWRFSPRLHIELYGNRRGV